MFYRWGTKDNAAAFDTLNKARIVIAARIADYLTSHGEAVLVGSDGSAYDIDVHITLKKK